MSESRLEQAAVSARESWYEHSAAATLLPLDERWMLVARAVQASLDSTAVPDPDAVCRCGHTAHWHAAIIYDGDGGTVRVPQGTGACEEHSEDGSPCGCEHFEPRAVQGVLEEITEEQVERACQAFERVTDGPYGIEDCVRAVLAAAREEER